MNTCRYCGVPLSGRKRAQCGAPECARLYRNERARQFARKNPGYFKRFATRRRTYERECVQCGETWQAYSPDAKYCSFTCQAAHQWGPNRVGKGQQRRRQVAARRLARAASGTWGKKPWTSVTCSECGTPFVVRGLGPDRTCSPECSTARQKQARRQANRARRRVISDAERERIYRRDRWRCQICGKPVAWTKSPPHHKAPTIDHVIPRSQGGSHDPANLQLAHWICNSRKSDRAIGEQLSLIG